MTAAFASIDRPYLLVTNIPFYTDDAGEVYLDKLWYRDLIRHTAYITGLMQASPASRKPPPGDWVRVEEPYRSAIRFVPLPPQPSFGGALLALPRTLGGLYKAVGDAEIVHCGVAGWPIPFGWFAALFATLRGRMLVVLIESAPWRLAGGLSPTRRARLRASVNEAIGRLICSKADLCMFSQPSYMESLKRGSRGPAYVTPASWIDEEHVLDSAAASRIWQAKLARAPRWLFAGRLHPNKGVGVLLEALSLLEEMKLEIQLDFIGIGDLSVEIDAAIQRFQHVRVSRLAPVAYGSSFFELLDGYHGLVVPSLADEQPRLVFDAPARAVPLVAADTDGLRPHVRHDQTGVLVARGNPRELADALAALHANPEKLKTLGLAALEEIRSHTHTAMHVTRSQILARHLRPASSPPENRD